MCVLAVLFVVHVLLTELNSTMMAMTKLFTIFQGKCYGVGDRPSKCVPVCLIVGLIPLCLTMNVNNSFGQGFFFQGKCYGLGL